MFFFLGNYANIIEATVITLGIALGFFPQKLDHELTPMGQHRMVEIL